MRYLRLTQVLLVLGLLGCSQDGAPGHDGTPGATGAGGTTGAMGAGGSPGATGAGGASGPAGGAGSAGMRGDAGPSGPSGDAGPAGPRGGGVVWKDATGATIRVVQSGIETATGLSLIADAAGYVWRSDIFGVVSLPNASDTKLFASLDCTGTAYVDTSLVQMAGVPYTAAGTLPLHVLAPLQPSTTVLVASVQPPGSACGNGWIPYSVTGVVPYDSTIPTTPIVAPTSMFVPPLHAEFTP